MANFSVPKNVHETITYDVIWEYDGLEPIFLSAFEAQYKGDDLIQYQLEFPSWEQIGSINRILINEGIELDGYEWEALIRRHLKKNDLELDKAIYGDSETETCVLWADNKEDFEQLIYLLMELVDSYEIAKKLLQY